MTDKFRTILLLLCLSGLSFNGVAEEHENEGEDEQENEKVMLCHKGKNTIMVGAAGLPAHLGHGDVEGYCEEQNKPEEPDYQAAVVMMHCEPAESAVLVTAFSSSVTFSEPPLSDIKAGETDCSEALADLLNGGFYLESVTGATDYLLLGKTNDS